MNKLSLLLAGTMVGVLLAAPASGQTLADRIAAVKEKHARQNAEKETAGLKTKMLQALLYRKLTVNFEEIPAREVFDYLKTTLGINLIARYSDDAIGHGIDPATPITLQVEDVPAVELLELVLEQCATREECTWQLRGSFVEAGTKERLSAPSAQELRVYPIGELLFEAPRFVDAPPIGFTDEYWYPYGGYGGYGGGYGRGYGGYGGGVHGGAYISPYTGGYRGGNAGRAVTEDPNTPEKKAQRAQSIIELITTGIEPTAWVDNGGSWATIRYLDESLIVRAPDYIHRQINGYGPVPPPKAAPPEEAPAAPAGEGVAAEEK